MGACHECQRTHNRDVRERGRCDCPCHTGSPRPRLSGRWVCRDCDYVTTREVTAYVAAARHSGQHGHAMTYVV